MARPRSKRPTDAETQILTVLWGCEECTVRDVWEAINKERKSAYTSVATIMRIMLEKNLVRMTHERRPQRFAAALSKTDLATLVIDDITDTLFDGSFAGLLRHGLTMRKRTPRELADCRQVFADAE